jgi:hypothetical protein
MGVPARLFNSKILATSDKAAPVATRKPLDIADEVVE